MREILILNLKRLAQMLENEKEIYGIDTYICGTRRQIKSLMKQLRLDTVKFEKELYDWQNVANIREKYTKKRDL